MGFKRIERVNYYSFTFQRVRQQAALRTNRPFVHEYEDWCDYMIYKEERKLSAQLNMVQLDGGWAGNVWREEDRVMERGDAASGTLAGGVQWSARFSLAGQGTRDRRASSVALSPKENAAAMREGWGLDGESSSDESHGDGRS